MRLSLVMLAAASIAFGGTSFAGYRGPMGAMGPGNHNSPRMMHRYCNLSKDGWDCRQRDRQKALRQQRIQR
jgi:hypothetical protein